MITVRASAIGWGALIASGAAAAALPTSLQAVYATASIAILGLPHGASDLALVPRPRRAGFLCVYLAAVPAVGLFWMTLPAVALIVFLALSFVHFAIDGRHGHASARDWAVAAMIVGGPAVLHRTDIAMLFEAAGTGASAARAVALGLVLLGVIAAPVAFILTIAPDDSGAADLLDVTALVSLLIAPPLVGFALGFVLLHAREQTVRRERDLGFASIGAYLRGVAPVLCGAAIVLAGLAAAVPSSPAAVRTLFVCLAALAMPHMLVTPFWARPSGVARPLAWRLMA